MPNFFQFTGQTTDTVSTALNTAGGSDLYFGCWVRIDPSNAAAPLCIASVGSPGSNGATTPVFQFWIQNNQLSLYATALLPNKPVITSVDTTTIADGNWHHVGFYFRAYVSVLARRLVSRAYFFKDGQVTNESATRAFGAGKEELAALDKRKSRDDRVTLPLGGSGGWVLGLGQPFVSSVGAVAFTGDIANVQAANGLMTTDAQMSGMTPNDLFNYVAGSYRSIPLVTGNTAALIALIPAELTSGLKAYGNLATNVALAIGGTLTIGYDSVTFFDGLTEMSIYAPVTAFPGSDTGTDGLSLALVYIVQNASGLNVTAPYLADLRGTKYADLTFDTDAALNDINKVSYPSGANFSQADFTNANTQLALEFGQVGICQSYYNAAYPFFNNLKSLDSANIDQVADNLSSNEAATGTDGNIESVVTLMSAMFELTGSPEIGAVLEGVFALVNIASSNQPPAVAVTGPLGAYQVAFSGVAAAAEQAWINTTNALTNNMYRIMCNWGALSLVNAYNTSNQFNWPITNDDIPADWASNCQINYARAVLTQVYQQYSFWDGFFPAQSICCDTSIIPAAFQLAPGASPNQSPRLICVMQNNEPQIAPSQALANYLFGTGATDLNCSADEFWYGWTWTITEINCLPSPP